MAVRQAELCQGGGKIITRLIAMKQKIVFKTLKSYMFEVDNS